MKRISLNRCLIRADHAYAAGRYDLWQFYALLWSAFFRTVHNPNYPRALDVFLF